MSEPHNTVTYKPRSGRRGTFPRKRPSFGANPFSGKNAAQRHRPRTAFSILNHSQKSTHGTLPLPIRLF